MEYLIPDGFDALGRLYALMLVPLLVGLYVALQFRRNRYALRFTNIALLDRVAPRRPEWRRHLAVVLALATIAMLIFAWAKPTGAVQVPRERATIVVTIDVSLSMIATDVEPNRLEAAKVAAADFVEQLPDQFNVSLVSFSGSTSILVPPTQEHERVLAEIEELEVAEATAVGEAIFTSLDAIGQAPADPNDPDDIAPARIVLLSDGVTTVGRPAQAGAEAAAEVGIPVYTIAFGSDEGVINIDGYTSPVPVDSFELEQIAETTDGESYTAESTSELEEVYDDIGSSVGFTTEQQEVTSRFVGFGLALAVAAATVLMFMAARFP